MSKTDLFCPGFLRWVVLRGGGVGGRYHTMDIFEDEELKVIEDRLYIRKTSDLAGWTLLTVFSMIDVFSLIDKAQDIVNSLNTIVDIHNE